MRYWFVSLNLNPNIKKWRNHLGNMKEDQIYHVAPFLERVIARLLLVVKYVRPKYDTV